MGQIGSKYSGAVPKPGDVNRNDQSQAEIFKLSVDHFEELFDWLSLSDLVAFGQTCKRMQRIVGYWIKTNYGGIRPEFRDDGIRVLNNYYLNSPKKICGDVDHLLRTPAKKSKFLKWISGWFGSAPVQNKSSANSAVSRDIKLDDFSSFLKKIVFECFDEDYGLDETRIPTKFIPHMSRNQFKSLTEIALAYFTLNDESVSCMKEILGQLEVVKVQYITIDDDKMEFYESFLQYCTKMKKLCVQGWNDTPIIGADNSWLHRKYPTLEHFELITDVGGRIDELKTFLEQNTNIHRFATSAEMILANREALKNSSVKFEVLSVEFEVIETLNESADLLNELFERGFYKQFHAYFKTIEYISTFDQETANRLASLNGLTKLYITGMNDGIDLSHLINLKQLHISNVASIQNMTTMVEKLINLEFIQLSHATCHDILQFICHSPKLTKIIVFRLAEDYEKIRNIEQLNEQRSKLVNASKVIVYVNEYDYSMVKWINNPINCNLVEIKRGASFDGFSHDFDHVDDPHETF